jgi:hypothetical protein
MASVKTILSPHIMQRIRQLFDNVNANRMQNRPESDRRLLQRIVIASSKRALDRLVPVDLPHA